MLFALAWRNVWRNKRRSLITIAAVIFAVMLSIVQRGLQIGAYQANIKAMVKLSSGFLQLQRPGYQDSPTLQKSLLATPQIDSVLRKQPEITAYSTRIYADGLMSYRDKSLGIFLVGIDPRRETKVSSFTEKLHAGRFLNTQKPGAAVIGYKLLKNMNLQIGDSVVVLAQGFDGVLGNMFFRIVGTLKTGLSGFDRSLVLIDLATAQELLNMPGRVSNVVISLQRLKDIPAVQKRLQEAFNQKEIAVLSWEQLMPRLKEGIELDNIAGIIFLAILVVVVAFGILNTVLMAVTERFREFGILLSLGMPQSRLVRVVFFEALIIILIGLLGGNLIGGAINLYFVHHPITFGEELAKLYLEYGFLPILPSTVEPRIFINSSLSILIVSLLAILYPLWRVFKLEPLKGIRYT